MTIVQATRCRSCEAPVFWAVTDGGKRMPVDLQPEDDGNLVIVGMGPDDAARVTVVEPSAPMLGDPPRYRSHFATCPNADHHRKSPA